MPLVGHAANLGTGVRHPAKDVPPSGSRPRNGTAVRRACLTLEITLPRAPDGISVQAGGRTQVIYVGRCADGRTDGHSRSSDWYLRYISGCSAGSDAWSWLTSSSSRVPYLHALIRAAVLTWRHRRGPAYRPVLCASADGRRDPAAVPTAVHARYLNHASSLCADGRPAGKWSSTHVPGQRAIGVR